MAMHRDLSSPVPWRRSLRASQARRVQRARRRRNVLRGRAGVTLAVAVFSVAAGGALAQDAATPAGARRAEHRHRARPAAEARRQRRRRLRPEDPRRRQALPARPRPGRRRRGRPADAGRARRQRRGPKAQEADERQRGRAPSGDAAATLQRIAQCESGGNPSAVSADGTYRGKYQFDRETWRAMGGSGDPADAPEAEQDRIAAALLAQRGTAPWPVCG